MIIKRDFGNGTSISIELTATELRKAYYEQQRIFDTNDILLQIEDMVYDKEIEAIPEEDWDLKLAEKLAPLFRDYLNGNKDIIETEWLAKRTLIMEGKINGYSID